MEAKIVLAGIGGQGIIFMTGLIGHAAVKKGLNVMASETHGMAQRGGSVVSYLKIGRFSSAQIMVGAADLLIGLNEMEFIRNILYLKSGGAGLVNIAAADQFQPGLLKYSDSKKIKLFHLPADSLALDHNLKKAENLIILGAAAAMGLLPVDKSDMESAIIENAPEKFRENNLAAFRLGAGHLLT